jgi:heterodisulfide reductase subunit C
VSIELRKEVVRLAGPEVMTCIQCGTCSSSCPTAHLMRPSIRQLVRYVLEGKWEDALRNRTIWLCTSCQLCTVRCPRNIRVRAVVAALKDLAEREGIKGPDQSFEEIFLGQIRESGRIHEALLSTQYLLANPSSAIQTMEMGLELAPKGKLALEREKIRGVDEVKKIIEELGTK